MTSPYRHQRGASRKKTTGQASRIREAGLCAINPGHTPRLLVPCAARASPTAVCRSCPWTCSSGRSGGGDAQEVYSAGGDVHGHHAVQAPQQHGVLVEEVHHEDSGGLAVQERCPGRARAPRRRVDPGLLQDRPNPKGADRAAQAGEFADDPAVSPVRFSAAIRSTTSRTVGWIGGRPGLRRL